MVSRCRVCRTPSFSNWTMSFRGSQGLRLEGPEDICQQGSGLWGEGAPSCPALGLPAVARAPQECLCPAPGCRAHGKGW